MITFIKGVLEQTTDNGVMIDNQGIGYFIQASSATLSRLPAQGQTVKLFTNLSVKEDGLSLYGFLSLEELKLFQMLITVSGVGPKAAMGILSVMNPSQIMIAILSDDLSALAKAPGVGKKTAQRLCLELKDKMRSKDALDGEGFSPQQSLNMATGERQDAADALSVLGYSRSEAVRAVAEVALEGMKADQIIKLALKKLVRI